MRLLLPSLVFPLVASATSSRFGQASNFNVSADLATKLSCDTTCQTNLQENDAVDLGIFDTAFDVDFYNTAANFSSSTSPGSVLKLKSLNGTALDIPGGVSVYKLQYTSQDLNGSSVPATGFIAVPFVHHQNDPLKLVAFAHGTTGVFHGCAPSTSSYLFDYETWTPLLLSGHAVVATDYAGLGNGAIKHKYISSAANANDVYWSVVAAQKAFPNVFTHEWVSIGHSQGGGAVYKLSEHHLVQGNSSGYLGGVAVAPITKLADSLVVGLSTLSSYTQEELQEYKILGELGSVVFALQAVYPNYTAPFLAPTMRRRLELAKIAQLCDAALSGLVSDLSLTDMIGNLTATDIEVFQAFQALNAPAQGDKASRPLLLIQGENDTIVFDSLVVDAYNSSCKAGNPVRLSLYPGLDHSATMQASVPEWLGFIDSLFSARVTIRTCDKKTVTPFDLAHAAAPLDNY